MLRTIITPDKKTVSIDVPEDYVGKQIEILLYKTDELREQKSSRKGKVSSLKGALKLTEKEYQDFQQYLKDVRGKWDRAI